MLSYTNFRGKTYFVHERQTKTGKTTYTCSLKMTGAILDCPKGYELHENPNGKVSCRKTQKASVLKKETKLLESLMQKLTEIEHFKVYPKNDTIEIHTATAPATTSLGSSDPLALLSNMFGDLGEEMAKKLEEDLEAAMGKDELDKMRAEDAQKRKGQLDESLIKTLQFSTDLRFVVSDSKERLFYPERMTYSGEGGWMTIDSPQPLKKLAKKYLKHLGKDSFYEIY
jgi:hypothetical protein